ncbi:peptide chain release factor N(5)-glutamine methyltransferase [Thermaurantiacus sp.]
MTAADLLRRAAAAIPGETPRLDAELLLAHAIGVTREALVLGLSDPPAADAIARFEALVARRLAHEPVAYILGVREFWSLPIAVSPAVLIPRPESETLIEAALRCGRAGWPATILDLGTGSGALLVAALSEWPGAFGVGVDRSVAAVAVARQNAAALGLGARARFLVSDWGGALGARFDLVLANPPYVEAGARLAPEIAHEPADALFAGADGLDAYRALVPQLGRLMAPGGRAILEIGAGQALAVQALLRRHGLEGEPVPDLGRRPRALVIRVADGRADLASGGEPGKRWGTATAPGDGSGRCVAGGRVASVDKLETCGR